MEHETMRNKLLLIPIFFALLMAMPVAAQDYQTYVTQQGDTLSKIALRYCTTWQEIYAINRQVIGNNPDVLFAGKVLTIPNRCGSAVHLPSTPNTSGTYDRGVRTHATGTIQGNTYVVAWGDTLFSIGQRFGLSVNALITANNMTSDNNIYVGVRLLIPGLQGGAIVAPPVIQPPAVTSRSFGTSECTIRFNSTTNIWNAPNGSVIASIQPGSNPARQVRKVNNALWYQFEYLETTPWVPAYLVGLVGNCGL